MENIGILISEKGGGVFQYGLSIADSLTKYSNKYNYKIITYSFENLNSLVYTKSGNVDHVFICNKKSTLKNKIKILYNLILNNNFFNIREKEIINKKKITK